MLETFVLIQLGVNVAILLALVRLLREREATARQAREREERLEALAAELCALGREAARHDGSAPLEGTAVSTAASLHDPESPAADAAASTGVRRSGEGPNRFRAAAMLLDRGLAIEDVARETALLPGELQVLRNLRRATVPHGTARPEDAGAQRPAGPRRHSPQKARSVHA